MTENERARSGVDSGAGSRGNPLRGGSVTTPHVTAPDFGRGGTYPSAGRRVGPAWRAAWLVLCDGGWHTSNDLAPVMQAAGRVSERTARRVLVQARRAQVLDVERHPVVGRAGLRVVCHYRIAGGAW